jgi:hypothetical protein
MEKWTEYDDAYSKAVFAAFEEALKPVLARLDPNWRVHHLELYRPPLDFVSNEQKVEIRIVMKAKIDKDQPLIGAKF